MSESEPSPQESKQVEDEVIGHMRDQNGQDTGQIVVMNKTTNRMRTKVRTVSAIKKKKRYECDICGRVFLHQGRLYFHRTLHKNIKYKCSFADCGTEEESKAALEVHQAETGHSGIVLLENIDNYVSKNYNF